MKRQTLICAAAVSALGLTAAAFGGRIDVPDHPRGIYTIEDAVNIAQSGDEIVVAPGDWDGCDLNAGYADPLIIRSQNPEDPNVVLATVVGGVGLPDYRLWLNGLTFKGRVGGLDARLLMEKCSFDGGGLDLIDPYYATVVNCTFTNGHDVGFWGAGAISVLAPRGAYIDVIDCAFYQNGGWNVVDIDSPSGAVLRGCTFRGNSPLGSAISVYSDNAGFALLEGCVISGTRGRGLDVDVYGTVELLSCKITGNAANGDGGGAWFSPTATVELRGCLIQGNTATGSGGGVYGAFVATGPGVTTLCGNVPNQLYGSATGNVRLKQYCPPPEFVELFEDLDGDGRVGFNDLRQLLSKWGQTRR